MRGPDDDVSETVPVDITGASNAGTKLRGRLVTQDHGMGGGGVGSNDASGTPEEDEDCPFVEQSSIQVPASSAYDDVIESVPVDVACYRYVATERCGVKPTVSRLVRLQAGIVFEALSIYYGVCRDQRNDKKCGPAQP
jgi:hypothetical protein